MLSVLCPEPQNFSNEGLAFAAEHFRLVAEPMTQAEFEIEAPVHDAVLVRFSTRVGEGVLHRRARLRSIVSPTTGLDHIDMASARAAGVEVHHLRGQRAFLRTITSTAELAFALILNCARAIPAATGDILANQWRQAPFQGTELSGRRLGIVGCGRLGLKVARMGRAFGMDVAYHDVRQIRAPLGAQAVNSLPELLCRSDFLSLHVPLDASTQDLIGARELALLPENAVLINTSRGAVVDEDALLAALRGGRLAGAGLDVLRTEPPRTGTSRALVEMARTHPRLVLTPHLGGMCREAIAKADLHILDRFLHRISTNTRARR